MQSRCTKSESDSNQHNQCESKFEPRSTEPRVVRQPPIQALSRRQNFFFKCLRRVRKCSVWLCFWHQRKLNMKTITHNWVPCQLLTKTSSFKSTQLEILKVGANFWDEIQQVNLMLFCQAEGWLLWTQLNYGFTSLNLFGSFKAKDIKPILTYTTIKFSEINVEGCRMEKTF